MLFLSEVVQVTIVFVLQAKACESQLYSLRFLATMITHQLA